VAAAAAAAADHLVMAEGMAGEVEADVAAPVETIAAVAVAEAEDRGGIGVTTTAGGSAGAMTALATLRGRSARSAEVPSSQW
jgi:hypothetical protein